MLKKLFIVLALFFGIMALDWCVCAQKLEKDSIFFTGVVMDQDNLEPLPNTHFRINRTRLGTTNQYGRFSFFINTGDTIQYSYVGYRQVKIVIGDSLIENNYLFGVFMTKDTISLHEVLILPRFGDFKQAFINTKINSPEYVHAKNNVNDAVYKALTGTPETMDAKANTDFTIKNYQTRVEYSTMVPPDLIIGVSLTNILPEIQKIKRKQKIKVSNNMITDQELKILKIMYQHQIKK